MREILFRGKRLQGDHWVEGYFFKSDINYRERTSGKDSLIFTPDCDTFIMIPEAHNSVMVQGDTVGQFTGLTDKNGRKIFEGDIVRLERWAPSCGKTEVVKYYDGGFAPFSVAGWECTAYWKECEVIGNIHDNPELLEGE